MTTLVGSQDRFQDALYALCELDYDAVEAYHAAIERIDNEVYKLKLSEFLQDHLDHIEEISNILKKHHCEVPKGPDLKKYLTQGKVILGNLFGDGLILRAMISNEVDTNDAYERINQHPDKWSDVEPILSQGLSDERKHKQWLEETAHKHG